MQDVINTGNTSSIIGTVERISYRNELNFYTVAQVKTADDTITVVGILPLLNEGDRAEFFGKYVFHQSYGEQFYAETFERKNPENTAAILRYLSSGIIKGIGPATANKIVERFGLDSLAIIENDPELLTCIKGITAEKAYKISNEYKKQFGIQNIMLLLSKYKISPDACLKIYKKLGNDAVDVIKDNPYILCDEAINFSFEATEEIAIDFNIQKENKSRLYAGLQYVLRKNLYNGHTCLPRDKFINVASLLLDCGADITEDACNELINNFKLLSITIDNKEFVAIPEYIFSEQYIAARLLNIKQHINNEICVSEQDIVNLENSLHIQFEELQRQAIYKAFENGMLVITGGPGTGKTTILNAIIKLFEDKKLNIELAAPTGRAAKRMQELTGKEAKTIHRLLEVEWTNEEKVNFARNEKNPLSCDLLILDEASMVDSLLFCNLLKALRLSCRIIIVGDSNQLPSINAGNILGDIISSGVFPCIELKKVFRQAAKSNIVLNAHSIINNETPSFKDKNSDCFFLERYDKHTSISTIIDLVSERLPKAYNINPLSDIQVLCPSKKLETGTLNLNRLLQEKLNPKTEGQPQIYHKDYAFRVGDKVMQTKNNYDIQYVGNNGEIGCGIFNGDVGYITEIDLRGGLLKVSFDDKTVTYFSEDIPQLEPAYAITVHKSQGSEYDYVVIPLCDIPQKLIYRNLLYTAVTRAKKMLILVGKEELWYKMVDNDRKTLRYTTLKHYINENSDKNL